MSHPDVIIYCHGRKTTAAWRWQPGTSALRGHLTRHKRDRYGHYTCSRCGAPVKVTT